MYASRWDAIEGMMNENDPQGLYKVLGVQPSATADEIRSAFRKLAKETHPDTSGIRSAERFHRISEAYDILSDSSRRAEYDRSAQTAARQQASKPQEKAPEIEPICCSRWSPLSPGLSPSSVYTAISSATCATP